MSVATIPMPEERWRDYRLRTRRASVAIIGSGPAGATAARVLLDRGVTDIAVVENGTPLSYLPGDNLRNSLTEYEHYVAGGIGDVVDAADQAYFRPGLSTVNVCPGGSDSTGGDHLQVSAAVNVGGMGALWTCVAPRPAPVERLALQHIQEIDAALGRAEALLSASTEADRSERTRLILEAFGGAVTVDGAPRARRLPLAVRRTEEGLRWTGPSDIVAFDRVRLMTGFRCLRLVGGPRASGALLLSRRNHQCVMLEADAFVLAAGVLENPRILHDSRLGGAANGAYLCDHSLVRAAVDITGLAEGRCMEHDDVSAVWLPFEADSRPWHGQVFHARRRPQVSTDERPTAHLSWYAPTVPQPQNSLRFGANDYAGAATVRARFQLGEHDHASISEAASDLHRHASILGPYVVNGEPVLETTGSSKHLHGTTRTGAVDDGTSVCDNTMRVWGCPNVFVAGNSVIPGPNACNPTLTTVALAVVAGSAVGELLGLAPSVEAS